MIVSMMVDCDRRTMRLLLAAEACRADGINVTLAVPDYTVAMLESLVVVVKLNCTTLLYQWFVIWLTTNVKLL